VIKIKLNLGLDIGSSDILSEFSDEIRSRNFAYSLGIDFLKHIFSFQKKSLKKFRDSIIHQINKNNFTKNIFYNIADKGFNF
jgi:2-octaprenyl-6-methoxyphenol hydroxylase